MRLRRFAAAAFAAALMVGMAGCADGEGTASQVKTTAPAAIGANLTVDDFGQRVAAAAMEAGSAHIEGTTLLMGQDLTVTGDVQAGARLDEFKLAAVAEMGGQGSVELRLVDSVVYVKLPTGLSLTDKPWVKLDLSDPENPIGAQFGQLISSLDPSKFHQLDSAVVELENLGSEDVRGVAATHYRVIIDTTKALEVLDLGKVAGVEAAEVLETLPKTVVSDVWVDDDALLVKVAGDLGSAKTEMFFSQWGEPVAVAAPPARQVGQLPF